VAAAGSKALQWPPRMKKECAGGKASEKASEVTWSKFGILIWWTEAIEDRNG
jgi:hypothetical protein